MAFLETPRFPERSSFGTTGGPRWNTSIGQVDSGYEYANQNWSQSKARYVVSFDARKRAVVNDLLGFFNAANGMFGRFRYKDDIDYKDNDAGHYIKTSATGVFAMLTSTTFQMYKRYTCGANVYNRKIQKPVSSTVIVTGGSGASVDYTTGIVTVSSGTPTAWTGEFDVPCRFNTDVMDAVIINRNLANGLIEGWQSIELVEVRL